MSRKKLCSLDKTMAGQIKRRGIIYTIASGLIFSVYPICVRLMLESVNIETTNVLMSIFATLIFLLIFVFTGNGLAHYKIILKNIKQIALLGLVSSVSTLFFTEGILISGPTKANFLIQLVFVFNVIFGTLILKERILKFEAVGIIIAVLGTFILAYSQMSVEIIGTLILIAASFLVALTGLLSKVYLRKIDSLTLAGGTPLFVLIFISIYSVSLGKIDISFPTSIIFYGFIAALTGLVLSFILLYKALQIYDLSKVSGIRTFESFLTVVWAFFVLSQLPTANQLLGGALIVIGIIALIIAKK